eukprot:412895_1
MGTCCSSAQIVPNARNRTSNKIVDNDADKVEQSEEETDEAINSQSKLKTQRSDVICNATADMNSCTDNIQNIDERKNLIDQMKNDFGDSTSESDNVEVFKHRKNTFIMKNCTNFVHEVNTDIFAFDYHPPSNSNINDVTTFKDVNKTNKIICNKHILNEKEIKNDI